MAGERTFQNGLLRGGIYRFRAFNPIYAEVGPRTRHGLLTYAMTDRCRSLDEIAPAGSLSAEQLLEFLSQPDDCIFTHGACHVLAAALYRELRTRGLPVGIYSVSEDNEAVTHLMVGAPTIGFLDVRLAWTRESTMRPEPIGKFAYLEFELARIGRCCATPDFLGASERRASAFVRSHAQKIGELVEEANRNL